MAPLTSLTPAIDTSAADWIVGSLRDFAMSVVSLVPAGFPAYVRVFHPAYRGVGSKRTPVRWAEIAAAGEKRAHAGMQLPALTGSFEALHHPQPGVFDRPPVEGSLPPELAAVLPAALAAHTSTPDRCWFAVWDGFGALRADVRSAPTFTVPQREYHLLEGPMHAVAETVLDAPSQSPNLWWPDDRAWCVATEIDLNTTYIGCSADCCAEIVALPEVEALPVEPAYGITLRSDLLNSIGKAG